ncbi:hypothetical protein OPQ81_011541 [Rhizoctonia solani]|nr:hypothetical protein OPQ81_011541 [Rhizoctonia solani]
MIQAEARLFHQTGALSTKFPLRIHSHGLVVFPNHTNQERQQLDRSMKITLALLILRPEPSLRTVFRSRIGCLVRVLLQSTEASQPIPDTLITKARYTQSPL